MRKLLAKIRKILKDRRTRQLLTHTVSVTGAIVVFVTTYALVLPAITMETEADCGIEAHQHDSGCYEDRLICDIPEYDGHQHTASCYEKILICGKEVHTHSTACYSPANKTSSSWSTESAAVAATDSAAAGITVQTFVDDVEILEDDSFASSTFSTSSTADSGSDGVADLYATFSEDIDASSGDAAETDNQLPETADSPLADDSPSSVSDANAATETDPAINTADGAATNEITATNEIAAANETSTTDDTAITNPDAFSASGTSTSTEAPAVSTTSAVSDTSAAEPAATSSTASVASTAATASTAARAFEEDSYVPSLDPLDFSRILTTDTGIYYYHVEDKDSAPENSGDIKDWKPLDEDTILDSADILRVYLAYSIPAGSLNATNPVARYRLPSNLHLSEKQVESINATVNGIANQYVSMDTLEIKDSEKYKESLGVEAIEGNRIPSDDIEEYFEKHQELDGQEYISATVKTEDVYDVDEVSGEYGEYLGQDLIFTFTDYTIAKNRHEYDRSGQPTKAGEKVDGWVCFDLKTSQVDWIEVEKDMQIDEQEADGAEDTESSRQGLNESEDSDNQKEDGAASEENKEKAASNSTALDSSASAASDSNSSHSGATDSSDSESTDSEAASKITKTTTVKNEAKVVFAEEVKEDKKNDIDGIEEISTTLTMEKTVIDESEENIVSEENASSDKTARVTPETHPAASFEESLTVYTGRLNSDTETGKLPDDTKLTVSVSADECTFPAGTTMKVSAVTDDQMDTVAAAVESAVASDDTVSNRTRGFQAVDITFYDADGNEIEPLKSIRVSMKSDEIRRAVEDETTAPIVVHVSDTSTTEEKAEIDTSAEIDTAAEIDDIDENGKTAEISRDHADENTEENANDNEENANENEENTNKNEENANENKEKNNEKPGKETTDLIATVIETSTGDEAEKDADLTFEAGTFSVYAIVYTVDFHWEADGRVYDFSIPGGGFVSLEHLVEALGIGEVNIKTDSDNRAEEGPETSGTYDGAIKLNEEEVSEAARKFTADVESVEFSNPELVWTGKVNEAVTVGGLKEARGLKTEYSTDLTKEQIDEINAQVLEAGDWALISLQPFTSEEILTVTMKNGDRFTVKVTDAQLSARVITADGRDYTITLTYGPEAGIPDGARLEARELLQGTDEYDKHYQEAWKALQPRNSEKMDLPAAEIEEENSAGGLTRDSMPENEDDHNKTVWEFLGGLFSGAEKEEADEGGSNPDENDLNAAPAAEELSPEGEASLVPVQVDIAFVRFFDISIIYNGKEIEPESSVEVSVEYTDPVELAEDQNAAVVHFGEGKTEVIEPETDAAGEAGSEFTTYTFRQDSFSVTATLTSYVSEVPDGGRYLILAQAGNGRWYAMNNQAQAVDVTDNLDENGRFKEVPDNCLWTFNKNKTLGFYTVSCGGRYLYLTGNSRTSSSQAGPIDVDVRNKNGNLAVYLSTDDNFESNWRILGFNQNGNEDQKFFLSRSGNDYFLFNLAEFTEAVDEIDTSGTQVDDEVQYIVTHHYPDREDFVESGRLSNGQSAPFTSIPAEGTVYAGVAVTAGHDAVSIGNNGNVTVSHDPNIHLVHVDYYYSEELPEAHTVRFNNSDKYDTKIINGQKYYEMSKERLHTDKTASAVEGGDGRSFDLTLEAWNVDWNIATIGMVLDASGSMAWDGDKGHILKVNGDYLPYKFLSQEEVNKILCTDYSDYSQAGYGNYTYFVYEDGKSVNEYAPLGYYDGSDRGSSNYLLINGDPSTAYASQRNVQNKRAGWYYVNTGSANQFNSIGGSKEYNGISTATNVNNHLQTITKTDGTTKTAEFARVTVNGNSVYSDSIKDWFVENDTTGKYRKSSTYGVAQGTPSQFYVDGEGYLHCFFFHSDTIFESYVLKKTDEETIKTEMLQDAIGSFTGTLYSVAPDSAIGMTRFSRSNTVTSNGFDDNQLPLINWTTDSEAIIGALNQAYGGDYLANSSTTDRGYANAGNLTVYDYGLTGNTSTQSGLTSFNSYLASNNGALNRWAQDNGKPVTGGYEYDKYVIVFTDGKDTDRSNSHSADAKNAADSLKAKGYNVITVLLAPESCFDENNNMNQEFTDARNFLNTLNGARTDKTVSGLGWTDTTFIARASNSSALKEIFVDIANKIAKTMTDMTVRDYIDPRFNLVDDNGDPITETGYYPEKGFTLGYDADRDMYYVEWTGQNIPTNNVVDNTTVGANGQPVDISVWSKTIRVRAKDDFLGGNEVLSNANVEGLNKVYPDGQPNNTNEKTARTFPRTTVDPALLDLELGSTEDTVFLGETIDGAEHAKLESAIGATVDSSWYYEYLDRYGTVTNTDYIAQIQQGTRVEIPYYYFPDETSKAEFDAARLSPNNDHAYMKDRIGTLIYEWVPCDAEGNEITITDPYNHLTTNTDDVHYRLKIKYEPYSESERDSYVNSMTDTDDYGRPIKDPVGTPQTALESEKNEGIATVHVVSGQLTVSKQVKKEDILRYLDKHDQAVFTFGLTKTGTPPAVYPALGTDYTQGHGGYTYPSEISVTVTKALVNAAEETDGYVTITGITVEKLPIGTYEVMENTPSGSSFEFEEMGHLEADANYRASVADGSGKVTFEIGELAADASVDTYVLSTKPYLNAQMVSVYAKNTVNLSVPVSFKKVDVGSRDTLLGNAVFSLFDSEAVDQSGKLKQDAAAIRTGITTDDGEDLGFADLGDLDMGTYYLVETKAPDGYVLPAYEYIIISVGTGEVTYQAGSSGEPRTAVTVTRNDQEVYLLEVYNSAGIELPSAGGPGTVLLSLLGIMFTGIAGAGLAMRKQRRPA